MINSLSVTASIYKVVQDLQTKAVTFYVYNQLEKTISAETAYTVEELYDILFDEAVQYQQSREVENE